MKSKLLLFPFTFFFVIITGLLLLFPKESLAYAATGLNLWFHNMIPTLLPFMIITSLMIKLNLSENFAKAFAPIMKPLFHTSHSGTYCIFVGFLCGFPMGAKVIAEQIKYGNMTAKEGQYLLSFCNNIGPIYYISFVLPFLGIRPSFHYLFGMYGLPLLYGFVLRRIKYRNYDWNTTPKTKSENLRLIDVLTYIDESIDSGIENITRLGGYMIFFNVLNLIPQKLLWLHTQATLYIAPLLEITSGIYNLSASNKMYILCILPFGGLSCIAQTYTLIKNTGLSLIDYIIHKLILMVLTFIYYFITFSFFS